MEDLNKAIMKMKAKQASSYANTVIEDFLQLISDDRFKIGAARIIKIP